MPRARDHLRQQVADLQFQLQQAQEERDEAIERRNRLVEENVRLRRQLREAQEEGD